MGFNVDVWAKFEDRRSYAFSLQKTKRRTFTRTDRTEILPLPLVIEVKVLERRMLLCGMIDVDDDAVHVVVCIMITHC